MWNLTREEGDKYGVAQKRLTGHSHYVQDVAISSDGQFALSGSWDATLRLWDLNTGVTTRRFIGHSKDVLSVAFSADNRQIVSGSRDRSINLWSVNMHRRWPIRGPHTRRRNMRCIARMAHCFACSLALLPLVLLCVTGTPSVSSSTRSPMMATRSGFRACASPPTSTPL